jgi:hypothetical protein
MLTASIAKPTEPPCLPARRGTISHWSRHGARRVKDEGGSSLGIEVRLSARSGTLPSMTDLVRLEGACRSTLGDPKELKLPDNYGYREGLALCVIDSVQSTGVKYGSVRNVVDRYRHCRLHQAGNPERDGTSELLKTFADLGDPGGWSRTIGNANRTYSRSWAPLKAEAVFDCATVLHNAGITTTAVLRGRTPELGAVREAWRRAPGQKSGVTWHYLLMLAGMPGVKPDRMILRFVGRALGVRSNKLGHDQVVSLVSDTAERLGLSPTDLDQAIWQYERRRR